MNIYRFKNGDACPCCGRPIHGMSEQQLVDFSLLIYGVGTVLGLADWIIRPGPDAIQVDSKDAADAVAKFIGGDAN